FIVLESFPSIIGHCEKIFRDELYKAIVGRVPDADIMVTKIALMASAFGQVFIRSRVKLIERLMDDHSTGTAGRSMAADTVGPINPSLVPSEMCSRVLKPRLYPTR